MYGTEPEVDREVIEYWHLSWPQILFIAMHGARTNLKAWKIEYQNSPRAGRPIEGQPIQFSKLNLFKFFRKYENIIWEAAMYMGQDLYGKDCTALKFIGTLNGAAKIGSLNDIGVLAASWAVEEVCQRIYQDWEEFHEAPEGEGEEFRDIWEPPSPEHHELHTDTGGYDESIMNEEGLSDFRQFKNRSEIARLQPGDRVYLKMNEDPLFFQAKVIKSMPYNGDGMVTIYVDDPRSGWQEKEKTRTYGVNSYLYYEYKPPEHEEVHTDIGPYDESVTDVKRIVRADLIKAMVEEVDRSIMKRLKSDR